MKKVEHGRIIDFTSFDKSNRNFSNLISLIAIITYGISAQSKYLHIAVLELD
jgi:hypothetical protein